MLDGLHRVIGVLHRTATAAMVLREAQQDRAGTLASGSEVERDAA